MIVIGPPAEGGAVWVIIGSGLVGSDVVSWLRLHGLPEAVRPTPWRSRARLGDHFLGAVARNAVPRVTAVHWLWAAGGGGFGLTETEAQAELGAFGTMLDAIVTLRGRWQDSVPTRFHLASSAGGLFESQRLVEADSEPRPLRSYGRLKLEQERLARNALGARNVHVYRLSSVYGLIRPGRRSGLVSTLIANSLRQRFTTIRGRLDTLRDYVWAGDVGRYISERMAGDEQAGPPQILASARPASIHDVRAVVHRVTGRASYVHCAEADNAEHITFAPSAVATGFLPSSLETNVRCVLADALRSNDALMGVQR